MGYKSPRLLAEAIHKEMEELRKLMMSATPGAVTDDGQTAIETLNILRGMFDELAAFSERPSIDDVLKLSPGDYVATMKPLVAKYHRQLMAVDKLAPALCEDLQASAAVVIVMGVADDGKMKTFVRTAHDPNRPEIALAVETLLAAIDTGTQQILAEGVDEAEKQLKIADQPIDAPSDQPLRVRYADTILPDDFDRNDVAELVIDANGDVIKDRNGAGPVPRAATQEEIDSCILVKDPGSGVGYEDEL